MRTYQWQGLLYIWREWWNISIAGTASYLEGVVEHINSRDCFISVGEWWNISIRGTASYLEGSDGNISIKGTASYLEGSG